MGSGQALGVHRILTADSRDTKCCWPNIAGEEGICILEWWVGSFRAPVMPWAIPGACGHQASHSDLGTITHLFCKMAECKELSLWLPDMEWTISVERHRCQGKDFCCTIVIRRGNITETGWASGLMLPGIFLLKPWKQTSSKLTAVLLSGSSFCTCLSCYWLQILFLW